MSVITSSRTIVFLAVCMLGASQVGAWAQDSAGAPAANLGDESQNWAGQAPFLPIVTLNLDEESKKKVRDLEDRQLQERRALEDRQAAEIRGLLAKQANEREELRRLILSP